MPEITAQMTLLDILSDRPDTLEVFQAYDKKSGSCVCCEMLFERLEVVAEYHDWDLNQLIQDLEIQT